MPADLKAVEQKVLVHSSYAPSYLTGNQVLKEWSELLNGYEQHWPLKYLLMIECKQKPKAQKGRSSKKSPVP
jgi:hypothetical protein